MRKIRIVNLCHRPADQGLADILFCFLLISAATVKAQPAISPGSPSAAASTSSTSTSAVLGPTETGLGKANPVSKRDLLDLPMEDLLKLEIPTEIQFVPTARSIDSLYGFNYSTFEIPRSVSLINRPEFDQRAVQTMSDLGQFSPGTYTPTRYGIPSLPVIRGQLGEIYEDGIRDRMNQNGFPTSFNSVEALEIVKGPASVLQSPGSQPSGFVNFVSKTPYYDKWQGFVRDTQGTYIPGGGSYFSNEWNLDVGGPLYKDQVAMRLSYLGREADSYYRTAKNNTQDLYAAVGYHPYDTLKIETNGQFIDSRYDELVGVNRPTQDLIDSRKYITGSYAGGPAFGGTIDPATLGSATIYPNQILLSPSDSAEAKIVKGSMKVELDLDDGIKVVSQTMGESIERRLLAGYTYTEDVPNSVTVESRTQFQITTDGGPADADWKHEINVGFSQRYERTRSYVEFASEYFNAFDLTQNPTSFIAPPSSLSNQIPIPGTSYVANSTDYASFDSVESTLLDSGIFYQHHLKFDDQWSILAGVRGDLLHANSSSLLTPLGYSDSESVFAPGWEMSLMYVPVERTLAYITYQRSSSYNSSYVSGAIGFFPGTQQLNVQDLRVDNDLYELGFKWEPIKTKLFTSADIFYQQRHGLYQNYLLNTETHGVELEGIYQPSQELNFISNFTYEETNFIEYSPNGNAVTANSGDFLPGGIGSPNYGGNYPTGNYRVPGQPKILYNAYAIYTHASGFGVGLGPQVTGEQPLNLAGNVRIPTQFTWNASIFYKRPHWEAKLDIFNFTDERNFAPVENVFPMNDLVFIDMPISLQGTIKYSF